MMSAVRATRVAGEVAREAARPSEVTGETEASSMARRFLLRAFARASAETPSAGGGLPSTEGGFFVVALIRAVLLEGGTGWDRTIPLEDSAVRD